MKDKLITLVATSLVKVGDAYDGIGGCYQPKKFRKDNDIE